MSGRVNGWSRRGVLKGAAAAAAWMGMQSTQGLAGTGLAGKGLAGTGLVGTGLGSAGLAAPEPALRGRFLTYISVVRVNQIEVTPSRSIGEDESPLNSPEHIRHRREAFEAGAPGAKMTWAISWLALIDKRPEYQEARRLLASYHQQYGDEITFIPGGYFAPMFDTVENNEKTIHDALEMISSMVGGAYRPDCIVAGFLDARTQQYLAEVEKIHVCQGQIWSQHGIDNGDGDGGICYPYYPSREHYLKPAQSRKDMIDSVCLDGWTCDFLPARREGFEGGFNSRLGVGPIETARMGKEPGRKEMVDTVAQHFDTGYRLNGFGWTTAIWETSLGQEHDLTWWLKAVHDRWPDTQVMTEGAFGLEWRRHNPDNSRVSYRFDAKGTGAPGSEKELEIEWFMNQEFRLALLRNWVTGAPPMVIDLTRYDLKAQEPSSPQREWSLMNVLNQKGKRPQDKPKPLSQLSPQDQRLIYRRYPELKKQA